jgi:YVTN family beta-propeller protein
MVLKQKYLLITATILMFLPLRMSAQWLETTIYIPNSLSGIAYPQTFTYNPTNNKFYCTNAGSDNVTVIDGATNSVITTIPVGDAPRAFAWNPVQNRTYVANNGSYSISVIRDEVGMEEDMDGATSSACNDIVISSNPAKTWCMVSSAVRINSIRMYNILGAMVLEGDAFEGCRARQVSLTGMSAGVYFIEVNAVDSEYIKRIIVTR